MFLGYLWSGMWNQQWDVIYVSDQIHIQNSLDFETSSISIYILGMWKLSCIIMLYDGFIGSQGEMTHISKGRKHLGKSGEQWWKRVGIQQRSQLQTHRFSSCLSFSEKNIYCCNKQQSFILKSKENAIIRVLIDEYGVFRKLRQGQYGSRSLGWL